MGTQTAPGRWVALKPYEELSEMQKWRRDHPHQPETYAKGDHVLADWEGDLLKCQVLRLKSNGVDVKVLWPDTTFSVLPISALRRRRPKRLRDEQV